MCMCMYTWILYEDIAVWVCTCSLMLSLLPSKSFALQARWHDKRPYKHTYIHIRIQKQKIAQVAAACHQLRTHLSSTRLLLMSFFYLSASCYYLLLLHDHSSHPSLPASSLFASATTYCGPRKNVMSYAMTCMPNRRNLVRWLHRCVCFCCCNCFVVLCGNTARECRMPGTDFSVLFNRFKGQIEFISEMAK